MNTVLNAPHAGAKDRLAGPLRGWWRSLRQQGLFTQERAMTVVAVILVIIFWNSAPTFLSKANFIDIGSTSSYFAIVAIGMTFLFVVGEIDLSLGATYGFTGTLVAYLNAKGTGVA
jgi:ribose transport system permease protein